MANTNWYYVEQGSQQGPFDDEAFRDLVQSGQVKTDTLVWHPEMPDWKPYADLIPPSAPGLPPPLAFYPPSQTLHCSLCGKPSDERQLLVIGYSRVCPACKPDFTARLREGFTDHISQPFGGFWRRGGAVTLDAIGLSLLTSVLVLPLYYVMERLESTGVTVALTMLSALIPFIFQAFYQIYMVGRWKATLGKMAFGLEVVTADGRKLSYLHSTGRYFAKQLSYILLGIGYLVAAFDSEKRALHDMICSTRVVRK